MICYFSITDQRTLSKEARAHWMARTCLGFGAKSVSKCLHIWTMRETRTTIVLQTRAENFKFEARVDAFSVSIPWISLLFQCCAVAIMERESNTGVQHLHEGL